MNWLYLLVNCTAIIVGALAGWRTRRLAPKYFAACVVAVLGLMVVRTYLYTHPEYEQFFLSLSDDYVYFASWEAPLVLLVVFGLAVRLRGARVRAVVGVGVALLAPLFMWDSVTACLRPEYAMPARFDDQGVCRQSTDYSCGPAAAVTLLSGLGVEVSEGEMSRYSLLRPYQGVTALELCRGLNVALRASGRRAVIRRIEPPVLGRLAPPYLAEMRRPGGNKHCVVVLEVEGDTVLLADPARGRFVASRRRFLRHWTGIAITVEGSSAARSMGVVLQTAGG